MTETDKPEEIEGTAVEEIDADPADQPEPHAPLAVVPEQVFEIMTVEDERQIMAELEGRALDVMVYSFPMKGDDGRSRKQTGLSWKGVGETVRTYNNRFPGSAIELDPDVLPLISDVMVPAQIRENGTIEDQYREVAGVQVIVYARNRGAGGGNWGMGVQPRAMRLKLKYPENHERAGEFQFKPDPFCFHKALSKAQRNAMEPLLPIEFVETVKAAYEERPGKVKRIPGATGIVAGAIDRPPPLTDEKAIALKRKAQGLYDRLRALNPRLLPPGLYANRIRAAEHAHDALEQEIEAIEHLLEVETAVQAIETEADPVLYREAVAKADRGQSRSEFLDYLKSLDLKGEKDA
jgi:hypothetical protein